MQLRLSPGCSLAGPARKKQERANPIVRRDQSEALRLKVLFYNHAGQVSGAERVLLLALARLNGAHFAPVVICPAAGPLKEMVTELGVPCDEVDGLKARFTWRLDRLLSYLGSFLRLV